MFVQVSTEAFFSGVLSKLTCDWYSGRVSFESRLVWRIFWVKYFHNSTETNAL